MSTTSFDKAPRPSAGPPDGGAPTGTPPYGSTGAYPVQPFGTPPYGQPHGAPPYGTPPYGQPYGTQPYGARHGGPSPVEGPGGEWLGPPLASWGRRAAGTLVDGLVLLALAVVLAVVAALLGALVAEGLGVTVAVLTYVAVFALQVQQLVVQGRTGQTIGKRAVGIKLVRLRDGQPVGPGLSIGRALTHVLDAYSFLLGYLWPLWDKKNQTFADKCLSTVVLKV